MAEGYQFQPISDFVVQIRHTSTDAIVGTGFVAREGIVTCAHVVRDAGVDPRGRDGLDVSIYYPEREGRSSIKKRAKVAACFDQYDDDVVLLHLTDGSSPLGPELSAKFGSAKGSEAHEFLSFGYRRLGNYIGLPASGTIVGLGDKPTDKKFQGRPLLLSSQDIVNGMSGAPVLDTARNLIIGVIYLAWNSAGEPRNRDAVLAVDARVLSLEPLGLYLEKNDLPKSPGPSPRLDFDARKAVAIRKKVIWNNAPPSLSEWTGREQLLKDITSDWTDARVRITGLIGFGGEGKSSLAREWVDRLLADSSRPQPKGVFWWGFYEKRNVDEFFDAALTYLTGGGIDVKEIPSANRKARMIGAMLGAGRYLFVLDGLEVLQYQDGDMYGSIRSPDLKAFLEFFASPDHESFCMVTSRAPLVDMISFATYKHRDVDRLSPQDGRDLLGKLGVQGKDAELDNVVKDWDGHALTLSLLASYLKDYHDSDIAHVHNIPPPTADEPLYDRVHRVLRRYDEHLDESAKAFLKLFSAFRLPVERDAFDMVFRVKSEERVLNDPIAALDDSDFQRMIEKLVTYRILRQQSDRRQYTIHPLIRAHYSDLLVKDDRGFGELAHHQIKDYYLARAVQNVQDKPTLEELLPFIEAVHHACQCGAYDEAFKIFYERINRRTDFYIARTLCAFEAEMEILKEFFPGEDLSMDPLVSNQDDKGWILHETSMCLLRIGRGYLAEKLYAKSLKKALDSKDWGNASIIYQNLSELYSMMGELGKSLEAAYEATDLARRAKDIISEYDSLVIQAWIYHLKGNPELASEKFLEAEAQQKKSDSSFEYLYSSRGIRYADYLRRQGEADYVYEITDKNLKICEGIPWPLDISSCHRVLGDLFADAQQEDGTKTSYFHSLNIARKFSDRKVLIEALLARGRWYARNIKNAEAAFSDLTEAIDYAKAAGYRLYEADIRIALAWAFLAASNDTRARDEAGYALQISQDMGYHWGVVDAKEVLAKLDER